MSTNPPLGGQGAKKTGTSGVEGQKDRNLGGKKLRE